MLWDNSFCTSETCQNLSWKLPKFPEALVIYPEWWYCTLGWKEGFHKDNIIRCRYFKVSSGKLLRSFPHDVHVNYASMRAWDWWEKLSSTFFVRLPFEKTYHDRNLLWKRNETSSKQQCSHHNGRPIFLLSKSVRYMWIDAPEMVVEFFPKEQMVSSAAALMMGSCAFLELMWYRNWSRWLWWMGWL